QSIPATAPDYLKDQLLVKYYGWIASQLKPIFDTDFSPETDGLLTSFLAKNWALVKKTMLSPTAIPHALSSQFLCQLASALDEKTPISCLLPGVQWATVMNAYPDL